MDAGQEGSEREQKWRDVVGGIFCLALEKRRSPPVWRSHCFYSNGTRTMRKRCFCVHKLNSWHHNKFSFTGWITRQLDKEREMDRCEMCRRGGVKIGCVKGLWDKRTQRCGYSQQKHIRTSIPLMTTTSALLGFNVQRAQYNSKKTHAPTVIFNNSTLSATLQKPDF